MNAFVFVLILFIAPDGSITGYANGLAADVEQCHKMIVEKLNQPDSMKLLEGGAHAKVACTETKPLPQTSSDSVTI